MIKKIITIILFIIIFTSIRFDSVFAQTATTSNNQFFISVKNTLLNIWQETGQRGEGFWQNLKPWILDRKEKIIKALSEEKTEVMKAKIEMPNFSEIFQGVFQKIKNVF